MTSAMHAIRWTMASLLLVPAAALAQAAPDPPASPESGDEWTAPAEPAPADATTQAQLDAEASTAIETEPAIDPETDDADAAPGPLVVGAEIGAIFPQPFSELGTHVSFGLELGYALPFLEERLEAMFAVAYAPPARSFDLADYEGTVDEQELTFSLGPRYRFLARQEPWNIAAALGVRLFLLRSTSSGSRDEASFAEFEEQSTQIGFFIALGGEYRLGPGALFLDIDLGYSGLPHQIAGDGEPDTGPGGASTGNIATTLGYRLFLL
jgi:hypothetical protein